MMASPPPAAQPDGRASRPQNLRTVQRPLSAGSGSHRRPRPASPPQGGKQVPVGRRPLSAGGSSQAAATAALSRPGSASTGGKIQMPVMEADKCCWRWIAHAVLQEVAWLKELAGQHIAYAREQARSGDLIGRLQRAEDDIRQVTSREAGLRKRAEDAEKEVVRMAAQEQEMSRRMLDAEDSQAKIRSELLRLKAENARLHKEKIAVEAKGKRALHQNLGKR
eukprot:TRINITY_DN113893_c0_g1_i1.p1 TRINITY_DN113893_c0_g1~~TRINITY_DN113893_c0_g1_i1.p1  ORF type:complete len:222 (+),score=36.53 TRINITY_DN113893_c0_g1_i1:119-784(+)